MVCPAVNQQSWLSTFNRFIPTKKELKSYLVLFLVATSNLCPTNARRIRSAKPLELSKEIGALVNSTLPTYSLLDEVDLKMLVNDSPEPLKTHIYQSGIQESVLLLYLWGQKNLREIKDKEKAKLLFSKLISQMKAHSLSDTDIKMIDALSQRKVKKYSMVQENFGKIAILLTKIIASSSDLEPVYSFKAISEAIDEFVTALGITGGYDDSNGHKAFKELFQEYCSKQMVPYIINTLFDVFAQLPNKNLYEETLQIGREGNGEIFKRNFQEYIKRVNEYEKPLGDVIDSYKLFKSFITLNSYTTEMGKLYSKYFEWLGEPALSTQMQDYITDLDSFGRLIVQDMINGYVHGDQNFIALTVQNVTRFRRNNIFWKKSFAKMQNAVDSIRKRDAELIRKFVERKEKNALNVEENNRQSVDTKLDSQQSLNDDDLTLIMQILIGIFSALAITVFVKRFLSVETKVKELHVAKIKLSQEKIVREVEILATVPPELDEEGAEDERDEEIPLINQQALANVNTSPSKPVLISKDISEMTEQEVFEDFERCVNEIISNSQKQDYTALKQLLRKRLSTKKHEKYLKNPYIQKQLNEMNSLSPYGIPIDPIDQLIDGIIMARYLIPKQTQGV